jgi:NTE family protein
MTRALVLGGGGPLGFAWECGLIAGFAQAGVDLGEADYILGTSAGALAGARLASGVPSARLAEAMMAPPPSRIALDASPETLARFAVLLAEAVGGTRNPAEVRRELGALALAARTIPEDAFVEAIRHEADLAAAAWPSRYACTAVDVGDGGFQIWDESSGVEFLPGVASSCSVPGILPPVNLKGGRYMDGGVRTPTNADMALGHELVVVIAVQPQQAPPWMARSLDAEVESLQSGGATVVAITLDDAASAAFGVSPMDPARKPVLAQAGLAQAAAQAAVLRELWG